MDKHDEIKETIGIVPQKEVENLQKQIKIKDDKIAKLKSSLDNLQAKYDELSKDASDNNDTLDALHNEIRALRSDNLFLNTKIKETKRKLM